MKVMALETNDMNEKRIKFTADYGSIPSGSSMIVEKDQKDRLICTWPCGPATYTDVIVSKKAPFVYA